MDEQRTIGIGELTNSILIFTSSVLLPLYYVHSVVKIRLLLALELATAKV